LLRFKPSKDRYKRFQYLLVVECEVKFQTLKGSLQTFFSPSRLLLLLLVSNPQRIATNFTWSRFWWLGHRVSNPQRIATNNSAWSLSSARWGVVSNPQRIATNYTL